MALFTDGNISELEDLAAQDAGVLTLASTEGIDLTSKMALAQAELGVELNSSFLRLGSYDSRLGWPLTNAAYTTQLNLNNVVVTDALKLWHTFRTLTLVYGDAYFNQLNDRYLSRFNAFQERSKWAAEMLLQIGVGLVWDPVPQAAAPVLSHAPGPAAAATYFVQVSWLNAEGQEGSPSTVVSIGVPDQNVLQVTPPGAPSNATGWNLHAGTYMDSVTLQNDSPLDPGAAWIMPATGLVAGSAPGSGQQADFVRAVPRILQRG